jgi:hypothetical protein
MVAKMVASHVKKVLDDEGRLLRQLAQEVPGFAANPTGDPGADKLNADNLGSWEQDLSGYRAVNTELAAMDKDACNAALKAEIDLLETFSNYISDTSPTVKYWKDKLGRDIELSKRLLELNQ